MPPPSASSAYVNGAGATPTFVAVGPAPADSLITGLTVTVTGNGAGTMNILAALCTTPSPTAANFATGRNVLQRSTVRQDGRGAIMLYVAANNINTFAVPLNIVVGTNSVWAIVGVAHSGALTARGILASLTVQAHAGNSQISPTPGEAAPVASGDGEFHI